MVISAMNKHSSSRGVRRGGLAISSRIVGQGVDNVGSPAQDVQLAQRRKDAKNERRKIIVDALATWRENILFLNNAKHMTSVEDNKPVHWIQRCKQ